MRIFRGIFILLIIPVMLHLYSSTPAFAVRHIFLTAAGQSQKFEAEEMEWGVSAKGHLTWYTGGNYSTGIFLNLDMPGLNILTTDTMLGLGLRKGKNFFYEIGAAFRYGLAPGPGLGLLAALGFKVKGSTYIFFPVTFKLGGLGGFQYAPYIGWTF